MSDLWPEFDLGKEGIQNDSLNIIREQARILGKKLQNRVKATFSKIKYQVVSSNKETAFSQTVKIMAELGRNASGKVEEVLEEDLKNKKDISEILNGEKLKFEIYNDVYRFRLFIYDYQCLYPNTMILDQSIAEEIGRDKEIQIESDQELQNVLLSVFSSKKVSRVLSLMIREAQKKDAEKK